MNDETLKFIISRIINNAEEVREEAKGNKNDPFYSGKRLAYYEVLDIIKNELDIAEQDLEKFGLDINVEREFL